MNACLLIAGLVLLAGPATGGTIRGEVSARGKEIPGQGSGGGAYENRKYKFLEQIDYDEVKEFVVYIEAPFRPEFNKLIKPVRIVVQDNAMFSPHIMPVLVGTEVEWPNEDDIYHNVFSFSEAKPFDLGLYKHEVKKILFDQVGRVDVFCSIHKSMNCIILVLGNPWFSATDEDGRYTIGDVPAGTYRVTAWQDRLPPKTQEVTVPETGTVELDFEMGITGLPRY